MNFLQKQNPFSDSDPLSTTVKPVNVASVPQRSPFRYPGGKTWFVPTFRRWMQSLDYKPELLIEPFGGGGIISLTALFENWVGWSSYRFSHAGALERELVKTFAAAH